MLKYLLIFFIPVTVFSQSIKVDENRFSPQELVEQVLINSPCIRDIRVTNAEGGNFADGSKSFGYFEASGTNFPISKGLVLSTGKLSTIAEPTSVLSDDDAPNWNGDRDLRIEFGAETVNATIIKFEFVPDVSAISFRYLFASEEYQDRNANTCRYSDLFAFFIKLKNSGDYENVALVPNTNTPVSVTTVHPDITEDCLAVNPSYFDQFNTDAPIVFDGQTTVLTASAKVVEGETYEVKLVIADDFNYRFDSAVFLEAGSFQPSVDLGMDRLVDTGLALCANEDLVLSAGNYENAQYQWYFNGNLLSAENASELLISEEGKYSVEVLTEAGCKSKGSIAIEYYAEFSQTEIDLNSCGYDEVDFAVFDLDQVEDLINSEYSIQSFHHSFPDAEASINPISEPGNYLSEENGEKVYARLENDAGCEAILAINLNRSLSDLELDPIEYCDDLPVDGFREINLNEVAANIAENYSNNTNVNFFESAEAAVSNSNQLPRLFTNSTAYQQQLYVRIYSDDTCLAITELKIIINSGPELLPDETFYLCPGENLNLEAGVIEDSLESLTYNWSLNGSDLGLQTSSISISESGNYEALVTDSADCSNSRSIQIIESEPAIIENIEVESVNNINSLNIENMGNGEYEFALDKAENFQNSSFFANVSAGTHTVYINDKNGCGMIEQQISVFGYDGFFSPNGDGINDTWKLLGVEQPFKLLIFDRYGKLLVSLDEKNQEWNGKFENIDLPEADYWFKVELQDGKKMQGHFSLIR